MSKLNCNIFAGIRNLSLVTQAEKLINDFIRNGEGVVYVTNPDGTSFELKKGAKFTALEYSETPIEMDSEGD